MQQSTPIERPSSIQIRRCCSAFSDRRCEHVRIHAVVVPEFKLRDVQRKVFPGNLVIRADYAALQDRPKRSAGPWRKAPTVSPKYRSRVIAGRAQGRPSLFRVVARKGEKRSLAREASPRALEGAAPLPEERGTAILWGRTVIEDRGPLPRERAGAATPRG
jgi:hypothetical protein